MKRLAIAIASCLLVGCGGDDASGARTAAQAPEPAPPPSASQMEQWNRSCALCHVDGTGGAPRVGVAEDWTARIAAGEDVLLAHTLAGYNNMPPLGYCMSCTEDDFRALVRFMSQHRGAQ